MLKPRGQKLDEKELEDGQSASRKRESPEKRKQAILEAALSVFSEQGFSAARLEDVAAKAGVAKGTLYLYFADKEALFEELLLWAAEPKLEIFGNLAADETLSAKAALCKILELQSQLIGTPRAQILRLLITEGHRFPRIAKFYHQAVISKGRETIQKLVTRGYERGEFSSDVLARFPQLFFAPLMLAVVWNGIFAEVDELDVQGLLKEHARLLFGEEEEK